MSFESILGVPGGAFTVGTSRLPVIPSYITWGDPNTDPASALGSMLFDAILSEEHDRSAIVTDHPVEQGQNIVDNVRPLPDKLELEVFVSNSPINSPDANMQPITIDLPVPGQGSLLAGGTTGLLTPSPPSQVSAIVDLFVGETDYPAAAYNTLTQIQSQAILLSVITPRATYSNMILESVKMHRNPGVGTSATFSLAFREVVLITSSVVAAPLPSIPRGNPTQSTGNQQTKTPTGPMTSVLKGGMNATGLSVAGSGLVQ
jgi:hypothetical protein